MAPPALDTDTKAALTVTPAFLPTASPRPTRAVWFCRAELTLAGVMTAAVASSVDDGGTTVTSTLMPLPPASGVQLMAPSSTAGMLRAAARAERSKVSPTRPVCSRRRCCCCSKPLVPDAEAATPAMPLRPVKSSTKLKPLAVGGRTGLSVVGAGESGAVGSGEGTKTRPGVGITEG